MAAEVTASSAEVITTAVVESTVAGPAVVEASVAVVTLVAVSAGAVPSVEVTSPAVAAVVSEAEELVVATVVEVLVVTLDVYVNVPNALTLPSSEQVKIVVLVTP